MDTEPAPYNAKEEKRKREEEQKRREEEQRQREEKAKYDALPEEKKQVGSSSSSHLNLKRF